MNKFLKLFICGFIVMGAFDARADDVDVATDTETPITQSVTARMDCKTMKAKIDELNANGASDELSRLQLQYRKDCVVRASGLRSSYRGGALSVANASVAASQTNAMVSAASVKAISTPAPANTDDVADVAPVEISDAQREMCERLPGAIDGADDDVRDALQSAYDEYCVTDVVAPDAVIKTTMIVLGPAVPAESDEEKYARIAANLDAGLCPDGATPNKFGCCGNEIFKDLGNLEFACCPKDGGECFPPVK